MDFKKASRDTNFDDFINGAEEKEIVKPSQPSQEKDKEQIILKLPKELCDEIDKRVIRRSRDLGLKNFTKQFILEDNQFLTDEAMLKIYQETTFYNLNIAEYIKQKLGFIVMANKKEREKSRLKTKLVIYSKEEKELLKQKAEDLVNKYSLTPKEYFQYQQLIEEIFDVSESDDYEYFKEKAVTFAQTATWKAALYAATNCLKIHC